MRSKAPSEKGRPLASPAIEVPLPPVAATAGSSAASAVIMADTSLTSADVGVERGHGGAAAHGLEGVAAAARAQIEQPLPGRTPRRS